MSYMYYSIISTLFIFSISILLKLINTKQKTAPVGDSDHTISMATSVVQRYKHLVSAIETGVCYSAKLRYRVVCYSAEPLDQLYLSLTNLQILQS